MPTKRKRRPAKAESVVNPVVMTRRVKLYVSSNGVITFGRHRSWDEMTAVPFHSVDNIIEADRLVKRYATGRIGPRGFERAAKVDWKTEEEMVASARRQFKLVRIA
jgi:hypothetical protein